MNRSLKLSMLMALGLCSSQLLAVDLGQIQVKSALGQPLLAEIPVHAATPAELQHLSAQLASSEDFAHAGISGGRTSIPLHFAVADSGGQHVIRITSATAVDDPYLDLLIEVHAGSGKSVREYTILLDPPGSPGAVSTPAVAAMPAPAPTAAPAPTPPPARSTTTPTAPAPAERTPAAPRATAATPARSSNGQYGPVARGQSLSSIAREATPADVDFNQMLLAIKQANPDAFYRDNINALKTGVVLRMPSASEARALAVAAAVAEVRRQNSDWRAGAAAAPTTVADTATRASASTAPTHAGAASGDRLALVPAKDNAGAKSAGNAGAAGKGEDAATLRQNLLRTQESLASAQQQSTDLKARVKDLGDINDKNTRLLALKDSQIAELQASLAAARKGEAAPAATGSAASPVTADATAAAASAATPASAASASTVAASGSASTPAAAGSVVPAGSAAMVPGPVAASTAAPPAVPASVAAAPPATAPAPAPAPWYMQTWAWAAGAAAIVLLLLLALLGRRRKAPLPVVAATAPSLADRFGGASADEASAATDVDQDELLDQLAEHPDDLGLHLELVTLYYSRRDIEHFEAAAEAMHAHIADPQQDEWQQVVRMGEDLVPGHPLFDHHVPAAAATLADDPLQDFDINDYADAPESGTALPPELPLAPKPVGGYAFDFNLTPAADASTPAAATDAADDAPGDEPTAEVPTDAAPADEEPSAWRFDSVDGGTGGVANLGEFNDDPIDTKLDLARAYLDMGDGDGARAMLEEVIKEGSQMQQDVARGLLAGIDH